MLHFLRVYTHTHTQCSHTPRRHTFTEYLDFVRLFVPRPLALGTKSIPPKPLAVPTCWAPSLIPFSPRSQISRRPPANTPPCHLSSPIPSNSFTPSPTHLHTSPSTSRSSCSRATILGGAGRSLDMGIVPEADRFAEYTFGGSQARLY